MIPYIKVSRVFEHRIRLLPVIGLMLDVFESLISRLNLMQKIRLLFIPLLIFGIK